MNKKVMALAVASVLAAPAAFAQSSNVQLYGRAVLGIDDYSANGARDQAAQGQAFTATTNAGGGACTPAQVGAACIPGSAVNRTSRVRIFDNSSRVGLRGTEDLGNGLKAIFQIETGVNIDNGSNIGQGGQNNTSSGFWASRDSFVGLDSNWGRLTFGRQSVYWANGVNAQFAANYINTEIPWTNGTNLGRISAQGAAPARVSNMMQYTSPTFAGINGTLSYSPNAQEAVQGEATPALGAAANQRSNGYLWGATLRGEWGPFYAQIDYADVNGNSWIYAPTSGGPSRGEGQAWKVGGSWGYMPGARIGLIWVKTTNNNAFGTPTTAAGVTTSLQTNANGFLYGNRVNQQGWTLNWEHTFGNFQVMAQYGQTGNIKGCGSPTVGSTAPFIDCGDSKSLGYMLGGRYFLSKRTWLFASWNYIDNKSNQFSDYTGGAITSTTGTNPGGAPQAGTVPLGADPQIWALGIFHNF